jgi:hypothetical protein
MQPQEQVQEQITVPPRPPGVGLWLGRN